MPKIMLDSHQLAQATSLEGKNTLSITWYLPLETAQDHVTLRHLSYWLGHEFPSGLCQHLKTEGYAYSVGANYIPFANIGLKMLNLELTPKGVAQLQDCLALIDAYLEFLRTSDADPDWIAQQQNIVENHWKSMTFEASLEQGFNLAQALQAESLRTFPFHSQWPTQDTVTLAKKALEHIHVQTGSKVLFIAETQEGPLSQPVEKRVEPWSQTPYEIRVVSSSKASPEAIKWSKTLDNPFLPQTLPVFQQIEASSTAKVIDTELGPFIQYENAFCGGLKDSLYMAVQLNEQELSNSKGFWCLFERSFNEKNYKLYQHAQEASQSVSLSREENGFSLIFTGYNTASGPKVIEELFASWLQFDLTFEAFERYKAELIENFTAMDKAGPLDRFRNLAGAHLLENKLLPSQMVECLEQLSFDDFCKMHQQVLQSPLSFVMMGVSSKEAEWTACFNRISKLFVNISKPVIADFPKAPFPINWKKTISQELIDYHSQQEGNLAVFIWPIAQKDSFKASLSFEIFQPVLSSSAFTNLRSKQQLGYIVSASKASIGQTPVFYLLVLSSNKNHEQIANAMQEEVQLWQKQVLSFSKEAFETQKARLLREYKEPIETSLEELSLLLGLWPYGKDPHLTFEQRLLELENLSFESCQSTLEKALSQAPYRIYSLPQQRQE
jgi:secreted Zn-dependent insulinase-like peptidase